MAEPGQGLALVTVLHDSRPELERLLASVTTHLPAADVVVVDSGSRDGGADAARAWPGAATVIDAGANVGFGRATNLGIERVTAPVTAVVNPDVELVDASLDQLASNARDHPARLWAPAVWLTDGSRQDNVHPAPTGAAALLHALAPSALLPGPLARIADPWRSAQPRRVSWAVACCLVAATGTLRRLGPFDQRIFLYGEDMELGLRAAAEGVETWFWPAARVRHARAHSTSAAFGGEPLELLARQRRAVIQERLGSRARARDDRLQALTFATRLSLRALAGRPRDRERAQLRAIRSLRDQPAGL